MVEILTLVSAVSARSISIGPGSVIAKLIVTPENE